MPNFKTGKQKSVMKHQFSQVPKADIPRSSFDRSHGHKTTFDAGKLIPIYVDEALPGDTFNLRMTGFARMATPIVPLMDNAYMDTHFFAVPIRLIWDNWEKFNGAQDKPADSTDFVTPSIDHVGSANELLDYMGVPSFTPTGEHQDISALFPRAYNLIWNEWFRDQNLQDSVLLETDDGPDSNSWFNVLPRGKRHDYFTSCLPWPQKGEDVTIGLGGFADVIGDPATDEIPGFISPVNQTTEVHLRGHSTDDNARFSQAATTSGEQDMMWNDPKLVADLATATSATINQLRQAFQIQKLLERDARGGTRYTEVIRAHFGVTSPDARLQRPEYLGGGSSPVVINPVAQTSSTDATTPKGSLSGVGTVEMHNHGFKKSFTEHCILIGLVSVRADLTYQQGLNRMWSRSTRFDYFWPALSHLGEQAVLNKEIYYKGLPTDDAVFGYQERFAEYRYKPSLITGKFRSDDAQSLDIWHLSQDFATQPQLNSDFIEENPPFDRVIAVPDEPHFIFDSYFDLRCARPMPLYGVPGFIDRF